MKFARELKVPEFAPRQVIAGKDAQSLSRELLAMPQKEFSAALKGSPMKRAKLRGIKRNAAVVLGNAGTADDGDVLILALEDEDSLVREHAACALKRLNAVRSAPARTRPDIRDAEPCDES